MAKQIRVALPFDPNPRAPRKPLPPGACDTHFHVFGPPNVFPFAADRRYEPPAAAIEHYFGMMKITGLSRAVVVQPGAHGIDNTAILDAIAKSGGRLKGIANIDQTTTDAELQKLKAGGVVGARFSLMSDRAGDRKAIEHALPRLKALDWSLDLHIEPGHFIDSIDFIRTFPVPTVIDHMARIVPKDGLGQPAFKLLLELLKDGRFWTKICAADKLSADRRATVPDGIPYKDVIPFGRAVMEAAPDRCIWGTDWPHGNTFEMGQVPNDGALLDLLAEMAPTETALRKVLVDNPARFYGF